MFIAGKKSVELKSKTVSKIHCQKCNQQNSTIVFVFGTYKYLFLIPFFSGGKFGKSVCSNCNLTLNFNEMTDAIKLAYFELKETVKTPIWFYAGTISIKVLVLIKIFSKYI